MNHPEIFAGMLANAVHGTFADDLPEMLEAFRAMPEEDQRLMIYAMRATSLALFATDGRVREYERDVLGWTE